MVNPIIPVATLLARLNAARSKASKLNRELVTESMKPRTRQMKERELQETIQKAKELEKQIPPDTPGFAIGGGVMTPRQRNITGLTNLFSKYNTSGPLAGAGVPRGTMQMQRGGAVQDFGGREQAYAQNKRFADMPLVDFNAAADVPQSVLDQIALAEAEAASRLPAETAPPVSEAPIVSEPPPAQTTTPPFTPSTGIVEEDLSDIEIIDTGVPTKSKAKIPQPDPLPPPPPPPVVGTPPPVMNMPPPVDVVQPPTELPLPPIEQAPLPPPVYTPPPPTEVVVPGRPLFEPPPLADTPDLPDPVMLSGETVDFDIADQITPQTGGYATTQGMNIAATGDPFADAVAGEYQMPIYRPRPVAGAMPFLSLRFSRPPTTPEQAPPPPQSSNYSTGSYGRLEFAEAIANWERLYGPVEDYQAPDTDAVMTDDTTQSTGTGTATGTGASTVTSGTRFYPEPPPSKPTRGGLGPSQMYRKNLREWEAKYGPVEDYYAAQEAAKNKQINEYLSRQGEEMIAAQYGYTVEELRLINADRRRQGLPPLGDTAS